MKLNTFKIWCRVVLAATATVSATFSDAETLRIGGTGVALGSMHVLSQAYMDDHPGTTIEVLPSLGSSGGVKALKANAIDISLTSRPLKQKEMVPGIVAREYAQTALAVVTAPQIGLTSITSQLLVSIYSGETTHGRMAPQFVS